MKKSHEKQLKGNKGSMKIMTFMSMEEQLYVKQKNIQSPKDEVGSTKFMIFAFDLATGRTK